MRFGSFSEMTGYYAERTPDAPALVFEEGGSVKALSFSAFHERIRERAEELKNAAVPAAGSGAEAPAVRCAGVFCTGSLNCVVDILAAARAGFQQVLLDPMASDELLKEQIGLSGADMLLGDEDLAEEFAGSLVPAGQAPDLKAGRILFFTSGTTASARAVALSEASLCCSAYNGGSLLPLDPSDRLLLMLPLNHVFGFVCGLLWPLSCGASAALGRGPRHYADDMAFFRPTAVSLVPLLLGFMLKNGLINSELELMLIGAGECPPALIRAAKDKGIRVSFGYGLTETSSGLALSLGDDPYALTVCPDDEIRIAADGEIMVRAPGSMMEGYYRDPGATERAFSDGWLMTGDLGFIGEGGRLWITGRKKDIFVLPDGTKVYLPEYEAKLSEVLAGRDFALFMKDGAVCLAVSGGKSEEDGIAEAVLPLMKTLPRGQQIRRILMTGAIPRTATGKVRRWALAEEVN